MAKIILVSYKTNVSVGAYRHKHVEAVAAVEDSETPEEALQKVAVFVHEQLGLETNVKKIKSVIRNLGDEHC